MGAGASKTGAAMSPTQRLEQYVVQCSKTNSWGTTLVKPAPKGVASKASPHSGRIPAAGGSTVIGAPSSALKRPLGQAAAVEANKRLRVTPAVGSGGKPVARLPRD